MQQIAVETMVSIIKDELILADPRQKIVLQRVLHEVRYVADRAAHPVEPPTWIRKGDTRIGKQGRTFDSRGETVIGKITAIARFEDGTERLQVVEGTARTGT